MRGFMKNNIKHDRKTKRNSNLSREMTYSYNSEANDKLELCITNSIMVENILKFKNKIATLDKERSVRTKIEDNMKRELKAVLIEK